MKKIFIISLTLICMFSILINIFQYKKISDLKQNQKFYDNKFKDGFNNLIDSFGFYDGKRTLSNECAIKNTVDSIESLKSIREFTSYKENKSLSLMLLYLNEFFVLKSNEFINADINDVKKYLTDISNRLDDKNVMDNFNNYLWQKLKK